MKIITEPTVYLIGKQTVVDDELQRFLDDHGITWHSDSENACEVIAEVSGRACYMSYFRPRPGGNKAYLGHIIESQHGSVLSHAVFNFMITGVSRSLSHELIRHSVGTATSQLSQRYVDESVAEYVCPPDLKDEVSDGLNLWLGFWDKCDFGQDEYDCIKDDDYGESEMIGVEWINAISTMHRAYSKISDYLARKAEKRGLVKTDARKFARQAARSVLPNATETKLMFTMNVRAIRNVLEQRGSRHAEPEIRKLAKAIYDIVIVEAPAMFSDYQLEQLPDGTYEITTQYRKV